MASSKAENYFNLDCLYPARFHLLYFFGKTVFTFWFQDFLRKKPMEIWVSYMNFRIKIGFFIKPPSFSGGNLQGKFLWLGSQG
ncbi:hypothetical protein SAMN04488519_11351 [Algoriphagus ornithinivorans]|uniref:Uncharacterized protein n=1 Tax=Algoriphagus ornithinivorans TaxID=226506 RepID=A0A1I5JQN1_9BACT|nr:hypothetical protein SAMN04488519_11351 [Algoriphagus ornithinivorans]